MIVPDLNLILYAEFDCFPWHSEARAWWEATLNGAEPVGLCSVVIFGFLRLSTNRNVFTDPMEVEESVRRAKRWLQMPSVQVLVPGRSYLEHAFRLLRAVGAAGNLTTDAQIAAHAVEVQGTVFSNDRDFARFEGVKLYNPLAGVS